MLSHMGIGLLIHHARLSSKTRTYIGVPNAASLEGFFTPVSSFLF